MMTADGVERAAEAEEIAGDEAAALVDELIERMLAVGAGLAPEDGAGLVPFFNALAVDGDRFAVAFHRELLEVSRQAFEILVVGQNSDGFCAEKIGVPDRE